MKTIDYLDALKASKNIKSDSDLASILGITRGSISSLRYGRTVICDETAVTVAEMLHIDPAPILLQAHAERTRDEKVRAVWSKLAAAISAGGFVVSSGQNNAPAEAISRAATPSPAPSPARTLFIMSTNVMALLRAFLPAVTYQAKFA